MPTHEKAPAEVGRMVSRMMEQYHQPLALAGVRVDVLMVRPDLDADNEPKGPALKVGGYEAEACIRVVSQKLRSLGLGDALMEIDAANWEILPDEAQEALVDHELTHLELGVKLNKDGIEVVQYDKTTPSPRPKLKLRRHDCQMGLFDEVVRRHKKASPEYRNWERFEANRVQKWLPYVGDAEASSPKRIGKGAAQA